MKKYVLVVLVLLVISCKNKVEDAKKELVLWQPYNDSLEVAENAEHTNPRMRYKLIQSKVIDKNEIFLPLYPEVQKLSNEEYKALKPLILEQNIYTLRKHIDNGELTYEKLVLFYLYRIYKYELDNATTLNTIVALNKDVVMQARKLDELKKKGGESNVVHPIYGMPILLKDNINTKGMLTTAGSIALKNNVTDDAFVVKRLKENGALILGKVNLSEWAYFLCTGCPVGYSAVGGQTLNPYGRKIFETGGSSAGSGTAVAANYAVAAVGTETSGSILSPSSQNSVVGLKPTIGFLSRTGIVPISSTLDTPGPMTKNVPDAAILLDAMKGKDAADSKSVKKELGVLSAPLTDNSLKGKRFGVIKNLLSTDSIYRASVDKLREHGSIIVEITPPEVSMSGFLSILNIDMKHDLPTYIKNQTKNKLPIQDIKSAVAFNAKDSVIKIPYGQSLFRGILADTTTVEELAVIVSNLEQSGRRYFNEAMDAHNLNAILSINNYHAGYAAVAKYPAITVPMGYKKTGEPISLTFIAKQFNEAELLRYAAGFESAFKARQIPENYN
ncbi:MULTISPECIES: amidase family protein [unclassified Cellulophaga]|uniref:amidase family protein n=1 Tax=unclassified Cellulophaga TaxID=2634405 RepID=UPI0026E13A67|nr:MULTISPECIES: amidase family protein [unclassified Cellulophaga]MDO6492651.1 amidase family protein [Cellulophaga sp. 2_MG-2023]MDO6495908.1 amidase family protein [Cellulophaga sp. 3_MG-2023]